MGVTKMEWNQEKAESMILKENYRILGRFIRVFLMAKE